MRGKAAGRTVRVGDRRFAGAVGFQGLCHARPAISATAN
ncbi:hypothetical protein WQQ_01920 [Hydrocarboniphaga effusa AP103]|uniref:Uncharacterized protein n=1 Tax=Hydrocarboniphaga effusa AP103 TaxID=1172194 RepID=I8T7Z0_9GAMM|nr:hypothetical protein WQQ_00050 [Hydrocarboniphaga effusa AP103]EIT70055.1 hypothetical protein WQQ_01920 [Hydrocarboniphaga effusa AP103]